MGGSYEIAWAEPFAFDLRRSPEKVAKSIRRHMEQVLRDRPSDPSLTQVKKLTGYRGLWRLRVSNDYRLVYRVDDQPPTVTLLMLGNRKDIYRRLDAADDGSPSYRLVADAPHLLEPEPTVIEAAEAELRMGLAPEPERPREQLPETLTTELLTRWDIPDRYHPTLAGTSSIEDLFELEGQVPEKVLSEILECLYPRPIDQVANLPARVPDTEESLEQLEDASRSLRSFLLHLDPEQRGYVTRFQRRNQGPWLLKGGPGSGKSTVALYCVRELYSPPALASGEPEQPAPRVLFTTFTKSLTTVADHLLHALGAHGVGQLDVVHLDRLVRDLLPPSAQRLRVEQRPQKLVEELVQADPQRYEPFRSTDASFLASGIEWVIIGQDLHDLDAYLSADRAGRGRRLTAKQRETVWNLHLEVSSRLQQRRSTLFVDRQRQAL